MREFNGTVLDHLNANAAARKLPLAEQAQMEDRDGFRFISEMHSENGQAYFQWQLLSGSGANTGVMFGPRNYL